MKRVLLIILFIFPFSLFADEKRVTEEMLLGDWECDIKVRKANWENGSFDEYGKIESDKGKIKNFMKDDVLYFNFGNPTSYPFQLESYYNNSEQLQNNDYQKVKQSKSIEYLTFDKYKMIVEAEVLFNEDSNNNIKTHTELVCERIKE